MPSHPTFSVDRLSGEELLARGLAVRGGGNVLVVPQAVYDEEMLRVTGATLTISAEVPGTLYVLQAPPLVPVKIGFTRAERIEYRMLSIQTGCPYPLKIIASGPCLPAQERAAHTMLRAHRLTGEWFDWAPEVAAFAETLRSTGVAAALDPSQGKAS